MSQTSFAVREAEPGDAKLIMSSWLKGYRRSPWAGQLDHDTYFEAYRKAIAGIIGREATKVLVAYNPLAPKGVELLGYVVYEKQDPVVVHWVYVKQGLRRNGVGRSLLKYADVDEKRPFEYTFKTLDAERAIRHSKSWNARFAPALARAEKGTYAQIKEGVFDSGCGHGAGGGA